MTAYKEEQKLAWAPFAPVEAMTIPVAARLIRHAQLEPGCRLLDVACGTGVVAITAALQGHRVAGLDVNPKLLERARESALTARVEIDWHEGDAEALPFADASFDAVLSQFGHIFAPRPSRAAAEMLRVLKPGGTLAFATWPPEGTVGRLFALAQRYVPLPEGTQALGPWGEPEAITAMLGPSVLDLAFDRGTMLGSALSTVHYRVAVEKTLAPVTRAVQELSHVDTARLAVFRTEIEALATEYVADNVLRQEYLLTRGKKASTDRRS